MKPGRTGISRVIHAAGYSIKGFKAAWVNEAAFRQELVIAIPLCVIAFFVDVTAVERILMISSVIWVLLAELFNSAIEAVVDRIGSELHDLSGRAKDIGSAAVFISIGLALFVWSYILVL
jgi:diacylglycerol kinase (ATP)